MKLTLRFLFTGSLNEELLLGDGVLLTDGQVLSDGVIAGDSTGVIAGDTQLCGDNTAAMSAPKD